MSDSHDDEEQHESPIKTPKQLIWTIVAAFVLPILIIILLVNYVAFGDQPAAGSTGLSEEAVAMRIAPVGIVELRDASAPVVLKTGEQVYAIQCSACHAAGVANAPKLGDEAAWSPRIKAGFEALLNSALKGKGAMAPQGGGDHSDLEIGRAVVFMANQGGAKFAEPKAPEAAASAASAPAVASVASAPAK